MPPKATNQENYAKINENLIIFGPSPLWALPVGTIKEEEAIPAVLPRNAARTTLLPQAYPRPPA